MTAHIRHNFQYLASIRKVLIQITFSFFPSPSQIQTNTNAAAGSWTVTLSGNAGFKVAGTTKITGRAVSTLVRMKKKNKKQIRYISFNTLYHWTTTTPAYLLISLRYTVFMLGIAFSLALHPLLRFIPAFLHAHITHSRSRSCKTSSLGVPSNPPPTATLTVQSSP